MPVHKLLLAVCCALPLVLQACNGKTYSAPAITNPNYETPCADENRAVEWTGVGWGENGDYFGDLKPGGWACDSTTMVTGVDSIHNIYLSQGRYIDIYFFASTISGTTYTFTRYQKLNLPGGDELKLNIDGVLVASYTGISDWTEVSTDYTATGDFLLLPFEFRLDQVSATPGRVWLDNVRLTTN